MHRLSIGLLAAVLLVVTTASGADRPDPRWLLKLDEVDRKCVEWNMGFAAPPIADVTWHESEPFQWKDLRGSVVVVQSWSVESSSKRSWPARVLKAMAKHDPAKVKMLMVHTPQEASKADTFLKRRPIGAPVVVDHTGMFSDAMGFYRAPVNVVIDRHGTVRFAGLSLAGLEEAVTRLLEETYDETKQAAEREAPPPQPTVEYPEISGEVGPAKDFRGKAAPEMFVEEWLTAMPKAQGKVVILDFWATWCAPCRSAIPHMNDISREFGQKVCCVGVSDETRTKFEGGLRKHNLRADSFEYALALDPKGRMKNELGIRGIPHVLIMSSDWVVRWQGNPHTLKREVVEQIIEADGGGGGHAGQLRRWRAVKERGSASRPARG